MFGEEETRLPKSGVSSFIPRLSGLQRVYR
jgi:hypothetical protein